MTNENLRTALLSNLFSYDWIIFAAFAVGVVCHGNFSGEMCFGDEGDVLFYLFL